MKTPGWSQSPNLGQGPDHFYKHLQQARRQLPDGQSIPENLPFVWPAAWIVIALGGAGHLARQYNRMPAANGPIVETATNPEQPPTRTNQGTGTL